MLKGAILTAAILAAAGECDPDHFPGVKKNDFGLTHALVAKFAK